MNTEVDIRRAGSVETYVDDRPDPFISMIERVVLDPNASVDKLERVLQLRNEEVENTRRRAREDAEIASKRAYFVAMSKCQEELPVVTKNQKNDHTKSKYADLAAIEDQAMPIIHRYGFGVSFQPDGYNENGDLRIKWEISHEAGHVRSDVAAIPIDGAGSQGKVNKTGTQAFGSTATYGRRYLLCMLFNISTGDDRDGNAIANGRAGDDPPISPEQAKTIRDLIADVDADIERFCRHMNVEAIPDIPTSQFKRAVDALEAKRVRK